MDDGESEKNKLPDLKLDAKQVRGFLSFFKTLPDDSRAVRLFDRRDYYTAHGDDATFIAKTYYGTTAALRQLGGGLDGVSTISISKNMFETIARDLLLTRSDRTLEIYEGNNFNWKLVKNGTPGNLGCFEDVLFCNTEMEDTPSITAVYMNISEGGCFIIGLAHINLTKRVLGLTEFVDDNHFTNMESTFVALGCKECLFPMGIGKSNEKKTLTAILTKCGVMLTERDKSEFQESDITRDLSKLVKGSILPTNELISSFKFAPKALGALICYTGILEDTSNHDTYSLSHYKIDSFMRLDSAAMKALNVLESKTDSNKNFSLFGLMNRTCTVGMGKRLLHTWLKQPLLDEDSINIRLDLVEAFVEDVVLRQSLRQNLKKISDIERLTYSIERKNAGLQHVVKLYQSTIRLPSIKTALAQYDGHFAPLVKERYLDFIELYTDADHLNSFTSLVETSVDLDQLEQGEYMISSGYSDDLARLKDELDSIDEKIQHLHRGIANDLDLSVDKTLKLDKATQFGFVFRITKKEEPKVRKKLADNFIVLETRKDGVKFTNGKLKILGDRHQKVLMEYKSCQKELVSRVVDTTATFGEVFGLIAGILSEMDVLLSFADLASSSPTPYTRPNITSSVKGHIILEGSRHPCVEAQDWVNFIPNDCKLIWEKSWFQIITGPNMGGKSTFIRQVGVNILMAQVGCFVPCDKASIAIRDCIFARVGASDCQLRGVSTFMQEMLETASILNGATEKSLIIIDELGRGTSTYDGFGLAWAICEHIMGVIKAPTLFATHFHELTALSQANSDVDMTEDKIGVENYHVVAHINESTRKLTMLYKVEPGACDQSFGIHVAEFANFPADVIALAREKAVELEDFSPATVISDGGMIELDGSKRRKRVYSSDEISDGTMRARRFLKEFSDLNLEKTELKQVLKQVGEMMGELKKDKEQYPWLQQFL